MVDLTGTAPRLATSFKVDPELVQNGLLHFARDATLDAAWGFRSARVAFGPVVADGTSLFGQHAAPLRDPQDWLGPHYLDRFDFSDPSQPQRLAPVNIPGTLLDFDAASGALLTLETLSFHEPASGAGCQGRGYDSGTLGLRLPRSARRHGLLRPRARRLSRSAPQTLTGAATPARPCRSFQSPRTTRARKRT